MLPAGDVTKPPCLRGASPNMFCLTGEMVAELSLILFMPEMPGLRLKGFPQHLISQFYIAEIILFKAYIRKSHVSNESP